MKIARHLDTVAVRIKKPDRSVAVDLQMLRSAHNGDASPFENRHQVVHFFRSPHVNAEMVQT